MWSSFKYSVLIVILFFLFTSSFLLQAQADMGRDTLRDLRGVAVAVEKLTPEVERDGLMDSAIQTDVELRLR
jgi:hypothetical protein